MRGTFICLLPFILSGCLLVQEEDNLVDIPKTPNPNNWADVRYSYTGSNFVLLTDTVYLNDVVYFEVQQYALFNFQVSIDDEVVVPFGSDNDGFEITKGDRPDGYYKLNITEIGYSGTRSLADRANVEAAEFQRNYVLAIEDDDYSPAISNIKIEDGTLKIEWNKYRRADFQSYEILKYYEVGGFVLRTFKVEDQNQTSFNDVTYAGGTQKYLIRLNRGGESMTSPASVFSYRFNPKFELERISTTHLRLSLKNRPETFNNIRYYSVLMANEVVKDEIDPAGFQFLDFKIVHPPLYIGQEMSYSIRLQAQVDHPNQYSTDIHTASMKMAYGKKIPEFSDAILNSETNTLYLNSKGRRLYKIDVLDYTISDSAVVDNTTIALNHSLVMSANRQHLLFMKGSVIKEIDLQSLQTVREHSINDLGIPAGSVFDASPIQGFAVSNNRFVLFKIKSGNVVVIDLDGMSVIYSAASNGPIHLSADGKYLVNGNQLMVFTGTDYTLKTSLPYSSIAYSQFMHSNPSQLFIQTPDGIVLYDCEVLNVVHSMPLPILDPYTSAPYFDQNLKKFLVNPEGNSVPFRPFRYVDIATGEVENMRLYFSVKFAIEGGQLLSKDGYAIKY